ncbi:MAG TPA: bifunctional diaminohydroxyphosphoribosylaminopyrimidine deaminase/5-amino-6-(5-phosphoribosylamino)uracil reductase RibD [Burkholderiales bacterium]|nr:bifunctional diaminohydroxyphosphoribosylaminopyrimidine deaminase/5-amino-6-(5-phosphoribosylamino)uracil reductase RibD [Burkholderiales bacterium]
MFTADDHRHMAEALRLAARGRCTTTPNPRVGCVIVRGGEVVGRGWHERAGGPHAEVAALAEAGGRAAGADLYLNLEPCAHHGRTPPCAEALVRAGVRRVVAAMQDPNPLVAGKGFAILRAGGVVVEGGLMEDPAREINIGFVSRMARGRPWVRLKLAASLDGRTALANGRSQWITGDAARRDAHRLRAEACAVLTGIGTVKDDDPRLTVRDVETSRQPAKVVVDSRLETPPSAKVLEGGVLVFCAVDDAAKSRALAERGAEIMALPDARGKVDLAAMLQELGRRGFNEVLVEAGFKLNGSLLAAGLVDELVIYLAPQLLGDSARGMFNLPALEDLSGRRELAVRDVAMVGRDLRITARLA